MTKEKKMMIEKLRSKKEYESYPVETLEKLIAWETFGRNTGIEKIKEMIQKNKEKDMEHTSFYGNTLKKDKLEAVALNIAHICEQKKGRGRHGIALPILKELDPFVVAAYGLDVVLSSISKEKAVQTVAVKIGTRIENGIIAQIIEAEAPHVWKTAHKHIRAQHDIKRQSVILKHLVVAINEGRYSSDKTEEPSEALANLQSINGAGLNCISLWSDDIKCHVGGFVLDIIARTTGMIEIKQNKRDCSTVIPTPEILNWIENYSEYMSLLSPEWVPLPIPPKKWTNPWNGGYHTGLMPSYKLISKASKNFLEEIAENADMDAVYNTVNAAQETGWRINKAVYDVAREMFDKGYSVKALPDSPELEIPACPICGQVPTEIERKENSHSCFIKDKEAHKIWKDATKKAYEDRVSNISRNIEVAYTLEAARRYYNEDVFYFPYYLDFRGRLYCRVSYLSPQGSGLGKSLLEFAEGKPLGNETAVKWLAIHVANCWGEDKKPMAERIKWTHEHSDMLCAVAENPLDNRIWADMSTKDAWPALAAAFEWAGYCKEGLNFVTHLPVAQDGTCSGLQHYAALLRDSYTAKQVNVAPSEAPADVYRAVAERTIVLLEELTSSPEDGEMAVAWLSTGIINRKLTKRSVMTLSYGEKRYSCKNFIEEYFKEYVREHGKVGPWKTTVEQMKACHWLGNIVWQAIGDCLTVAPIAMKLLQKTARILAKEELPLNWTTPSGFKVQQAKFAYTSRRVTLALSGDLIYTTVEGHKNRDKVHKDWPKSIKLSLQEATDVLNEDQQANGVAPNLIHSLDASAMALTVDHMLKEGVKYFALIHDSFGVHATDSELLAHVLREEFVKMYKENDPIAMVYDEFAEMLSMIGAEESVTKIRKLQKKIPHGDFDINEVKKSLYFFA